MKTFKLILGVFVFYDALRVLKMIDYLPKNLLGVEFCVTISMIWFYWTCMESNECTVPAMGNLESLWDLNAMVNLIKCGPLDLDFLAC